MTDAEQREQQRAKQAEWQARPDIIAARAARIAAGLCVTDAVDEDAPWLQWCVTHGTEATMRHHFDVNPDADTD